MTLMSTWTTRWTTIVTLLFFGGQLFVPAAWAQSPSMPASGAPATGAAGAPASPAARPPATPTPKPTPAGAPAASREGTGNTPWPREATEGGRTFTVYQPQIEKWDGIRLHARAAVSVESQASPLQHFGVVWFSARADVDKANRLVALADFKVDKFTFPVGARPGRRVPEGARAAAAPGSEPDLARPDPGGAGHHRGPAGRGRLASAGQERSAARHPQHGPGPPGARGRQARPPSGRRLEHEPASGRKLVGPRPRRPEERQALPAGGRYGGSRPAPSTAPGQWPFARTPRSTPPCRPWRRASG